MSGEKIIRGLKEAVAVARGEDQPARVHVKPAGQTQGLAERQEARASQYHPEGPDHRAFMDAIAMIRSLASRNEGLEEALTQISTGIVLAATDRDEWIDYVTKLARQALSPEEGG